jgi:hypothetical protein
MLEELFAIENAKLLLGRNSANFIQEVQDGFPIF